MFDLKLAGVAVQKCVSGDPISDEEIAAGIGVLEVVIEALQEMGSHYYLAISDLNSRLSALKGFQRARQERK